MPGDIDLSLHLSEHGLRVASIPAMVAGVSARRPVGAPADFRHYVSRFGRTYRAHHLNKPALRAPAVVLRSSY